MVGIRVLTFHRFFFFNVFISLWLCCVFIAVRGLSLVAASGAAL